MHTQDPLPRSIRFISIGVLCFLLSGTGHRSPRTAKSTLSSPAYIQRGNQVQEHYQTYSKRLAGYYKSLLITLGERAPDLLSLLDDAKPIEHGYQVLPAIISDSPPQGGLRASSSGYSWPWTDRLIDSEARELFRSAAELRRARTLHPTQSRAILEKLALDYRRRRDRQSNIDAHVQYNRFWQAAIATDRAGYDHATAIYHDVLERLEILDGLKIWDGATARDNLSLNRINATLGLAEIAGSIRRREALLAQRINNAMSRTRLPSFVVIERDSHGWTFRIPLFTDIEDRDLVATVQRIIESTWQLRNAKNSFRVKLDITYLSTDSLYADSDKPIKGEYLDILTHLGRFPSGGAILTTGALTTHVQNYAIVLGPHALTPRVLAHEFGHILGFRDAYFRGYKDLGENGFQIMEVVSDPSDIMAAPLTGVVLPSHFEMMLDHSDAPQAPIAPASKIPTQTRKPLRT
jgi:hypothetical protein